MLLRLLCLSVLALGWLQPAGAAATTFALMEPSDLARSAGAALVGHVTAIESAANASGGIFTRVTVHVDEALKGAFPAAEVTLTQPGGTFGGKRLTIHGSAKFRLGERVLLFVSQSADGSWHTSQLSMGKFEIITDTRAGRSSAALAVRDFGTARVLGRGLRRLPSREETPLPALLLEIRNAIEQHGGRGATVLPRKSSLQKAGDPGALTQQVEPFTFIDSPPVRWFDVDVPVGFDIDPNGDAELGPSASTTAVEDAMDAWSSVSTASIIVENAGPATSPGPIFSCDGISNILFNDPFDEIDPPFGCSGVLALGGGCASFETEEINGTIFERLTEGDVTFNAGFAAFCDFKIACNFAEVAVHEIGHTIGLGHSADPNATMADSAHFDGRCAGLRADDIAGATFIYPAFTCGDGIEDPNFEECDDANVAPCDGCSSTCTLESGFLCGDGEFNPACDPECDDGNLIEDDGCDSNCTFTSCGNGILTSGEECDDGNLTDGDGCTAFCVIEFCGDAIVNDAPNEQCDDGNAIEGDGCDSACQTEYVEVAGKRLLLKDKLFASSKRRLVVQSKDLAVEAPAPGGGGDPTLGGAMLRVVNPSTLEEQLIPLPAPHWKGLGSPPGVKGYKYLDRTLGSGPCKVALVRAGQLKAVCKGSGLSFSLDEPSQGSLAITLRFGTDLPYCMAFGGSIKKDRSIAGGKTGLFNARDAPAPGACPAP